MRKTWLYGAVICLMLNSCVPVTVKPNVQKIMGEVLSDEQEDSSRRESENETEAQTASGRESSAQTAAQPAPVSEAAGQTAGQTASDRETFARETSAREISAQAENDRQFQEQTSAAVYRDYIFPDSSSRYLTREELVRYTKEELRIGRNEIYARHGRKFTSPELSAYFGNKDWYRGTVEPDDFDDNVFNAYEKANIVLLKEMEPYGLAEAQTGASSQGGSSENSTSGAPVIVPVETQSDAPSKQKIDSYGYTDGCSSLSFSLEDGTVRDKGEYYEVEAVYLKAIAAPGNMKPGDEVTLVFDDLTGERRTLVYRDGALHPADTSRYGDEEYYYHPSEDGSPVVLYYYSDDRVEKPVYEGKLYVRKDATAEVAINNEVHTVTRRDLNGGQYYNGVYFDDKGYVTRLVFYGD